MRTLNPILQAAMNSGSFTPIVRAAVLDPDDFSIVEYLELIYYKIHGLDIEIEFYSSTGSITDSVSLERGAKIGDVEYTIFSGIYKLNNSYRMQGGSKGLYKCSGNLIDQTSVNVDGDGTYHEVIDLVLAYGDILATFKTPSAAWLSYQFLTTGQHYLSSNIFTFFALLRQKYCIYAIDNGITASPLGNSLLFFSVADTLALAAQYTIHLTAQDVFSLHSEYRQFVWKDETGTIHYPGPELYLVHNLGYLESTSSPPDIPDNADEVSETVVTVIPNLKYQTGDCVKFDPGIEGFTPCKSVLDVTEIFDTRRGGSATRPAPAWYMELRPLQYFSNTPGGYIPSSALYTAAYSQLATNGFIGVLNSSVNNVQALADAVDAFSDVQYRSDAPSVQIPGKDFAWSLADGLLYVWTGGAWHTLGTGDITGSGVVGQVAEFVTNTKTIQAAKLIAPTNHVLTLQATAAATLQAAITAGKTLTLTAADSYNLNIPASGTAALLGSSNVFTTQQMVDGTADQIQVRVQGHSTQTARLQTWEDSAGTVLSSVSCQGYLGIGIAPATDRVIKTSKTDVSTSGYPYTIELYGIHNPPTNSTTKIYTLFTNMIGQGSAHLTTIGTFLNQVYNDNTNLTDYAFALNNQVCNRSTGTLSFAYGQSLQITNTGGGTISNAYGEVISVSASTGTITAARGVSVTVPSISGTGSIGTAYGIRVDGASIAGSGTISYIYAFYIASVSGATTTNYAIYTNAGLIRAGDQIAIDGSANRQQFVVTGYTTQAVATSIAQLTRNDTAAGISVILGLTARGSGAAGDGGSVLLSGKSSTTAAQVMGSIKWAWNVATHASAAADVSLEAGYNNGSAIVGKEFLRGRGGSSPLVGVVCTLAAGGVTYRTLNVHGSQLWLGQDSSSESPIFELVPAYISNSHSFYTTRTIFNAYDAEGTYECIRFDAVAEARIGFFGAAAVPQQAGCAVPTDLATAITAIKALRTALNAYGLTTVV